MADQKSNPFLKLMQQTKQNLAAKATPVSTPVAAAPAVKLAEEKLAEETSPREAGEKLEESIATSNPWAVLAASQNFLSADNAPTQEQLDLIPREVNTSGEINSLEELARLDTDDLKLEPVARQRKPEVARAAELTRGMIIDEPNKVRELCDYVDSLLEETRDPAGPTLIELRNYVQSLMVTLKSHPEFDSILIDKDVRNIIRFIRATRETALATRDVKVAKKVTRTTNKEKATKKLSGLDAAFAAVLGSQFKK